MKIILICIILILIIFNYYMIEYLQYINKNEKISYYIILITIICLNSIMGFVFIERLLKCISIQRNQSVMNVDTVSIEPKLCHVFIESPDKTVILDTCQYGTMKN